MRSEFPSRLKLEYARETRSFSKSSREEIESLLLDAQSDEFPSGFNLAIVNHQGTLLRAWGGALNVVGDFTRTRRSSRYDLASLTKVVSTTTLVLTFIQDNRWTLDQKISSILPDFPRDDITVHQLLTHTSGLIAHRPFFLNHRGPKAMKNAVYEESRTGSKPGDVLYSDLNFMLLGWALEATSGHSLEQLFAREIANPLKMRDTNFQPRSSDRQQMAATELDGDQRLQPGLVWGEVHDGNAWAMGGVAGHAGLFAPVGDMGRFVRSFLAPAEHPILKASTIRLMTESREGSAPEERGLGWRLNPSDWGNWPEGTFWHTGFTGTSLLVSPAADLGVVLLTNAIHPTRQMDRQAQFRAALHGAIARYRK